MLAVREYTSAVDVVNQMAAEGMGINRTDHRVLELLSRRGPMTAGDLAEASHLTTGAITTVLDRLERAGFARRVRDSEDRRRVLVEETSEGVETAMRFYAPFMKLSFEAMSHYNADQLTAIRDFMREAAQISAEYAKKLAAAGDEPPAAEAG